MKGLYPVLYRINIESESQYHAPTPASSKKPIDHEGFNDYENANHEMLTERWIECVWYLTPGGSSVGLPSICSLIRVSRKRVLGKFNTRYLVGLIRRPSSEHTEDAQTRRFIFLAQFVNHASLALSGVSRAVTASLKPIKPERENGRDGMRVTSTLLPNVLVTIQEAVSNE